jgi:hypothetical protein
LYRPFEKISHGRHWEQIKRLRTIAWRSGKVAPTVLPP